MAVAINLSKGQTINLTKESGGSKTMEVRAKWNTSLSKTNMDLDLMAVELTNGVCHDIAFYGCKDPVTGIIESKDKSIRLSGDDRTGGGKDWNEIITIKADKINSAVDKIACTLSIYEFEKRGQNFGLVRDLSIEIYDVENNNVIATFSPDLDNPLATAMVLCEFIIRSGNLFIKPIAQEGELIDILKGYNIECN